MVSLQTAFNKKSRGTCPVEKLPLRRLGHRGNLGTGGRGGRPAQKGEQSNGRAGKHQDRGQTANSRNSTRIGVSPALLKTWQQEKSPLRKTWGQARISYKSRKFRASPRFSSRGRELFSTEHVSPHVIVSYKLSEPALDRPGRVVPVSPGPSGAGVSARIPRRLAGTRACHRRVNSPEAGKPSRGG